MTNKITETTKFLLTREAWLGNPDELGISGKDVYGLRWPWKAPKCLPSSRKNGNSVSQEELRPPPFIGLYDRIPIVMAAICGLQHSLSMIAGLITPPMVMSTALNLPSETQSYMISASLITAGLLSLVQMSRLPVPVDLILSTISGGRLRTKQKYYIGTGLLTVVGTSFATLSTASSVFNDMYENGTCPSETSADGVVTRGPCPEAFGYLLGTASIAAIFEIMMAFVPIKLLRRAFPPLITGPVVILIGIKMIGESGFLNWAGGAGDCAHRPTSGDFMVCPNVGADVKTLPWGSAEYLGLGFLSFITIVIVELFGSPFMRNASILIGLLVGCIVAAPLGYCDSGPIERAKPITFLWTTTFPLKVYAPAILPMIAVYVSLALEAIGDTTACAELSGIDTDSPDCDSRLQGSVLADGINGILAALMTNTPMSVFAQNNGVISLTRCANRRAGFWNCFWLVLYGVIGKLSGVFLAIPSSVLGGVTTFLFASVAASGLRILTANGVPRTRRDRFILAASFSFGFGNLLVKDWASFLFENASTAGGMPGFTSALQIVIETPFIISALVGMILNMMLPYEDDDREVMSTVSKNDSVFQDPESNSPQTHHQTTREIEMASPSSQKEKEEEA